MRIGKMRVYANIESYTAVTGDRGQQTKTWSALYTAVPMAIEALSGRQLELAQQQVATATHRITFRYLSGITDQMRVNYNGRLFNIGFVNEQEQRPLFLILTTTEERA